jgi:hypothetical protein
MAATRTTTAACTIVFAAVAVTAVIAAARQSSAIGLKEINYAREPLTVLLRRDAAAPLSPQQAKQQLEARGLRDISPPRQRGRVAIMAATAQRGERVTLVIDLFSGEITGARLQAVPERKDIKKR